MKRIGLGATSNTNARQSGEHWRRSAISNGEWRSTGEKFRSPPPHRTRMSSTQQSSGQCRGGRLVGHDDSRGASLRWWTGQLGLFNWYLMEPVVVAGRPSAVGLSDRRQAFRSFRRLPPFPGRRVIWREREINSNNTKTHLNISCCYYYARCILFLCGQHYGDNGLNKIVIF